MSTIYIKGYKLIVIKYLLEYKNFMVLRCLFRNDVYLQKYALVSNNIAFATFAICVLSDTLARTLWKLVTLGQR